MEIKENLRVEEFQKLHQDVGWKILDSKEIALALKNSMFVVGAVENGETVGMARVTGDFATHGLLCDVIVTPSLQDRGIGKALVQHIMKMAQDFANKHDQFIIEVLPTAGKEMFYVKCGFKYAPEKMAGCYKWFKNENKYGKN